MRIGIDFDNTLVNYDKIFQSIAKKMGLQNTANPKDGIKSYLLTIPDGLKYWKEIQAVVYGEYIKDAYYLPDFIDFCNFTRENDITLFIISYKTKYACTTKGRVSLHKAANDWIQNKIDFFPRENIYFELTMKNKIARIKSLNLDFYFDDLISVFKHRSFPNHVKKVLFTNHVTEFRDMKIEKYEIVNNWSEAIKIVM
jgi:2-hydroxy-3-keto-5-methylthiopentenyl-1-phosphate phosphatase